jgi:peptide/nickel transport system substrate-binding protein
MFRFVDAPDSFRRVTGDILSFRTTQPGLEKGETMKRSRVLAVLTAGALIAAACGGSDGDSGEEAAEPVDSVESAEPTEAPAEEPADSVAEPADEPAEETPIATEPPVEVDDMTPQRGGTLTYLLEAESDTWDIPGANCAVSCITVMQNVADPMTIVNNDGEVEPFLLEEFTPNDDFSAFTLKMRDGVTFHDGTPADGAAVQRNLIEMASGLLQGQVFFDLVNGGPVNPATPGSNAADSIVLNDDDTVTVTFDKPFATFGYNLAGRTGWLIAPSFWDSETRASDLMVATGPFTMEEQVRDEVTKLVANPNYWRTDANGEQLPYLDGIDFRPVPDVSTRKATMESGDADGNMDSFGENSEFWDGQWLDEGGQLARNAADRETTYLLINNAAGAWADPQFRRAVALCTDRDQYLALRAPQDEKANGPFASGSLGFMEDPGFPDFDAAAGSALLDEIGRPEVVNYGTTNVPSNLLTAELFAKQWSENCGLNVNIDQFDQSELITKAITGDFEVFLWRNHGQGNPGLEFVWWHSRHAEGLALNFGRIKDPQMDDLLFQSWATTDQGELDAIAKEINQLFAAQVYNIWLNTTEWRSPYQANVHGVGVMTLPSGNDVQGSVAGRMYLHEAWKDA